MALKRTVIKLEVLWDDKISPNPETMSLKELADETFDGHMSGRLTTASTKILNKKEMAKALIKQGSDPEFLIPNSD